MLLEDHEQRPVVYSRQAGRIDAVRRDTILHRVTSPEVMQWYRKFGILTARHPIRVPGQPEREILPRICAPAWYRDRLLGFLWLIDTEEGMDEADLAEVEKSAEHAALLLYEERLAQRLVVQAVAHLLSPSEELRDAAASQLVDQSLLREGDPVVAVVVQPLPPSNTSVAAIEEALLDVGWEAPAGTLLRLACSDHGVLLVRLPDRSDDAPALAIARSGREMLERRLGDRNGADRRVVASLGDPQCELRRAAASYRQARLAARVASAVPLVGDVVRWRDLGVFRALAQLPNREALESAIDPRVAVLLATGDMAVISTLETYLDLAGDAKATAEQLHLHRGTLYYRLDKAERMCGINVRNGYDRLAVHLGLKLARLARAAEGLNGNGGSGAGISRPRPAPGPAPAWPGPPPAGASPGRHTT